MSVMRRKVEGILGEYMAPESASSVLYLSESRSSTRIDSLKSGNAQPFLNEVERLVALFVTSSAQRQECMTRVSSQLSVQDVSAAPLRGFLTVPINREADIMKARTQGRELCTQAGFSVSGQVMVATAVSEIARNVLQYARCGEVRFALLDTSPASVEIVVHDDGPGIADVEQWLNGKRRSSSKSNGLGLFGTSRLMDEFTIQTAPGRGTEVRMRKFLA